MTLRVVGSGFGRTGTHSLKLALEHLLGGSCYHMVEIFSQPGHIARWHAAARNEPVDWPALFEGYVAAVDVPSAVFWRELSETYPEALVLHSERAAEEWWRSASATIFTGIPRAGQAPFLRGMDAMMTDLMAARFTPDLQDRDSAIAAYERHNATVRASAPSDRLLVWRPGDGWEPLCAALGVPVPDRPFPHTNTTAEFRQQAGLDQPQHAG